MIRCKNNDWKTMSELFFMCCDDIKDIELTDALKKLLIIFAEGMRNGTIQIAEAVRLEHIDWYVSQPKFIQNLCWDHLSDSEFLTTGEHTWAIVSSIA